MQINFKWIGGATWILNIDDIKIACDPVLCQKNHVQDYRYFKSTRLNNPIFNKSDFQDINLWLLTHNHEDHVDESGFIKIEERTAIIAHKSLKPKFEDDIFINVKYPCWNEQMVLSINNIDFEIKAVPAIHAKKKFISSSIGNGNGYLLKVINNNSKYNIYVTGDSVFNKNIEKYFQNINLDLIITNAGSAMIGRSFFSHIIGRVTNNISDIIDLNAVLKPKVLIPIHWGTFSHYSEIICKDSFKDHENIKFINVGERIKL
jgi:N-acyl-phosphatidylethanolamine-hydrolysing phospholipase D